MGNSFGDPQLHKGVEIATYQTLARLKDVAASEVRFVSRPSNYIRQQHFVGKNKKEITEAMSQAGLQWDHCDVESQLYQWVHTATYPARDHGATYKCIIPQAREP